MSEHQREDVDLSKRRSHWIEDGDGNRVEWPIWLKHTDIYGESSPKYGLCVWTQVVEEWPDDPWPDDEPEVYERCSLECAIDEAIEYEIGGTPDPTAPYGRAEADCFISGHVLNNLRSLREFIDGRIAYLERFPAIDFATTKLPTETDRD